MRTIKTAILLLLTVFLFTSCNENKTKEKARETEFSVKKNSEMVYDKRVSLKLNAMQKNHQKTIMRDHLDAVQYYYTFIIRQI